MKLKTYFEIHPYIFRITKTICISILGLALLLIVYFCKTRALVDACDGSFLAFGCLFGWGSLKIIINNGAFDSIAYSFANMFSTWQKNAPIKYKDLIEYKEIRAQKRKKKKFEFIEWYVSSGIYLISAIICLICYNIQISQITM